MSARLGRIGMRTMAGTLVATIPAVVGCTTGPTYDQWATTDGAAGRINLDAVQDAFKKSTSASRFEVLVNQIYEGDGLVLIRAKQEEGAKLVLEGWEDLNSNNQIDDALDDLLFTIEKDGNDHDLRGYGANSYYRRPFGGDFLFTYLIVSSLTPRGYYYQTSPRYARSTLNNHRTSYRGSSQYRTQVSKNSKYFSGQKSFASSKYNSAGRNLSTSRKSYQQTQKATGRYRGSGTGVRSSWGSSSRSSRFGGGGRSRGRGGGFRGFGGGQAIGGDPRSARRR